MTSRALRTSPSGKPAIWATCRIAVACASCLALSRPEPNTVWRRWLRDAAIRFCAPRAYDDKRGADGVFAVHKCSEFEELAEPQ